ncbi:MAG: DNA polymerase III subunit delta [Candidatus Saganbacteria bacterium]|nr:DNA polymerase III subunit delta [Candidatus Saganbacteria bacterium]
MIQNIRFLYGEEDFLLEERVKQLLEETKKEVGEDLTVENFGENEDAEKLPELLSLPSLFAANRCLVIRNSDVFEDKELADNLLGLLENLATTEKVFFIYYGMPDGRNKFVAWLKKNAVAEEFRTFAPWQEEEVIRFIVQQAGKYGKKIGSHAAHFLWEMGGSNLRHLVNEIAKVSTYIGDKDLIEEKDVLAVLSAGEMDAFSFVDSLKRRNVRDGIKNLSKLLGEREDPIRVLGLLASQFRMLLKVKALWDSGSDQYQISSILKAKAFFVKKTLENVRSFSVAEVESVLHSILNAEYNIKCGQDARGVLEDLVMQVCAKGSSNG